MAQRPRQISAAVARLLHQERLDRDISIARVAKAAGLSEQMVRYVEREMRNPTLDTFLRIAQALDVDLWKLIRRASVATGHKK
jgi:transcriptional regulator with XRE-family HTH domain